MNTKTFILSSMMALSAAFSYAQQSETPVAITLFESPEHPTMFTAPSYRIPAIAQCSDGSLIAIADYRYQLSDVGVGNASNKSQIELRFRRSMDGGITWSDEQILAQRNETDQNDWKWAMGDAAIVADRESGEVLVLCASGSVGNGASTAENPIRIGMFRSHDNGATWDDGEEITQQIYGLYEGEGTAIFITSGGLCQSRMFKSPEGYYRIYAAHPIRTKTKGNSTSVIYSDDFGHTWHVLGAANGFPTNTVYEEGKVEEMPDGSIMLMVRDDSGAQDTSKGKKNFNVFTFTNVEKGEGNWSTAVSGITGMAGACNSAIRMVPVQRTSDGKQTNVVLVPLPFHTTWVRDLEHNYGRKEVGFYYKEIDSRADYESGEALASGWKRGYQVTDKNSAYTDLCVLTDGRLALYMEDNGKQGTGSDGNKETEAYDMIFRTLSVELITNGEYTQPTQIETVIPTPQCDAVPQRQPTYDLQGRRTNADSVQTQVFISNNKKYISLSHK